MSYPNQLKIKIHKPTYDEKYLKKNGAFMQIGIEEWQEAYRSFKGNASAMGMFFYLASNANGYDKYLSKADFENVCGKSKSSYHRAIDLLKEKGYIYKDQSGSLNFATTPHENCEIELHKWEDQVSKEDMQSSKTETVEYQERNSPIPNLNTEKNIIKSNKENRQNNNLKKASPSSPSSFDLSYLREEVDEDGNFDETSFQTIIPRFEKVLDPYKVQRIAENTRFSEEEAYFIVYEILSDKWRIKEYGRSN